LNRKQIFAWLGLTLVGYLALRYVQNGVFGLLDNGPMLLFMLMGLDPDGAIGGRLARFKLDPTYVACGVAMFVNTMTDGIAGLGDPDASFWGVVLGCLIPIAFLPIIWKLRNNHKPEAASTVSDKCRNNITRSEPTTYSCPWRVN
jgi:hypothetical protein